MLNRLDLRGVPDPSGSLPRPQVDGDEPVAAVRSILAEVRRRGDAALIELTERFDGVVLERVRVPAEDLDAALAATPDDVRAALELARDRIRAHHETQLRAEVVHDTDGVHIRSFHRPVDRVGCYVPGGRAAYPSTLLMTAVPAQVAGVPRVAVCVPPDRDTGRVTTVTLAAAAVAGVDEVYAIGDTVSVNDSSGRPVPGIAPAAKQMGAYVGRMIDARARRRAPPPLFRYIHRGNLATIGRKAAVADIGGFWLSGFPAWVLWAMAHVWFLIGWRNRTVVALNWVWSYVTFQRGARLITSGEEQMAAAIGSLEQVRPTTRAAAA